MITKKLRQAGGGRFPAAGYNEGKVLEGVADLLLARNVDERFLRQLDIMHAVGINAAGEVERYMREHSQTYGNSKTQNKQFHVALSVKEHGMDRYELADFAEKFMERMGYGGQPYFVYFHHDTGNNHVHILSTRINRYGIAISDSFDKMRMQRVTDEILGITPEKERRKLFSYSFQTEGQFLCVARSCGYNPKEEVVDGEDCLTLFRNHYPQLTIPKVEVMKRMVPKEDSLETRKRKERARQLKAILLKYRQMSLQQQFPTKKDKAVTKSDLEERKTLALSGLRHKDGTSFNEAEKLQVKWMLKELRQKLGVDIHWQKDKNGIIRGYGIVDHKTKTAFDGSQVLRMGEWMDIQTKRNEEKIQKSKERASESRREHVSSMPSGSTFGEAKGSKAQKSIGSSGQHIAINTDSITIAKHKNGKHYLRVIFNNFGHSEIFFLSKEETRAYLLATNAQERERLKQQFTLKYLFQAMGGSHDQNREWEVGNGYDGDNGMGMKR